MISVAVDDHREPIEPIGSEAGHVRYITTGSSVPEGADAVVKVEDTIQSVRPWNGPEDFFQREAGWFLLQKSSQFFVGFVCLKV